MHPDVWTGLQKIRFIWTLPPADSAYHGYAKQKHPDGRREHRKKERRPIMGTENKKMDGIYEAALSLARLWGVRETITTWNK